MGHRWFLNSESQVEDFLRFVSDRRLANKPVTVEIVEPHLSPAQFNAMHLWFSRMADCLNEAGYSVMHVLKHDAEIPWTQTLVKEHLWRPVQLAMTEKASTKDAGKIEVADIYSVICRHLAQSLGIEAPPWPTKEDRQ